MRFPSLIQADQMDCGPTCLRMIACYYGKDYLIEKLRELSHTTREGSTLLGLSEAAEKIGFRATGVKVSFGQLARETFPPCIAHWDQGHYVVIYKTKKNKIFVSDPAHGLLTYDRAEFLKHWASDGNDEGVLLLLEATPLFYEKEDLGESPGAQYSFRFLSRYVLRYKKLIGQLFLGLIFGGLLQMIFPFLTQSIVDVGIQGNNVHFIYLILFAQLLLFLGRTSFDILRGWILIHVSSRINISLVSDFFAKLMKLPISYFDTKMTGDLMQRINDHYRIESFLTSSTLNTLFSVFNLLLFSFVLAKYNLEIFFIFLAGSVLYFAWITFFMKRRAKLDYKRFRQNSRNQSKIVELISGMQEIKLHNAERHKRWQWENIQVKLFRTSIKSLALTQAQSSGSALINELKNILITFVSAKLVLDGQITLGMMLSISYITGQLNAPVHDLISFMQQWQDARLSLERLSEIHGKKDEEPRDKKLVHEIPAHAGFTLENVSFKYNGAGNDFVLKDLNLEIPAKKVTAIVGSSGSGKTTLMKLLLKFYEPESGKIFAGHYSLNEISSTAWRSKCGAVMQEGFIFSDTIAANIAPGTDEINTEKLKYAAEVANIREFIEALPAGYNTQIGAEGAGLSTGQKQRILIARAVYKDPEFLFFDEATSALDANNEKIIMNNLNTFFKNKTVIIIAHRLSTVKNADQILVLDKGRIIENDSHSKLTEKKGAYYELVKNQLELGN